MYQDAARLVDGNIVIVFVENVEGDELRSIGRFDGLQFLSDKVACIFKIRPIFKIK
jgi:hypothetical protein